ncbi:hypothetical protein BaRGS_00017132 [Batillaria attramentaria]|uniref:Uncharacterized protein n=1 Tax=Batillaria attramentaria TaxID=370345 RepID=A0ABD0KXX3_9CAEN
MGQGKTASALGQGERTASVLKTKSCLSHKARGGKPCYVYITGQGEGTALPTSTGADDEVSTAMHRLLTGVLNSSSITDHSHHFD